jgi:hypothetical protein
MIRIAIGLELSSVIGAGCRYFDILTPSPQMIPAALIVLAMTVACTSMARIGSPKEGVATTRSWNDAATSNVHSPHVC